MKIRQSFVTNSSSSSYIIVSIGDKILLEKGDTSYESCCWVSLDIDDLIRELQEAKDNGIKTIDFESGGGYDG